MDPVVEAAIHAFEQGWSPIPIIKGKKRPAHSDWGETRYKSRKEIESAFEGGNLGVVLGDASNGLIDIDLDCEEAVALADGYLPMTRMIHGRESAPRSHYWYQVKGWNFRVEPFYDPVERDKQQKGEEYDRDRLVLVEIRGNGGQTLLPPSIHPDGDTYRWYGEWYPPAVVPHHELDKHVRYLAAASLLARYWPGEGKRHAAAMALAGGILRLGDEELAKDADAFVVSIALVAGDEEGEDRADDVASTRKAIARGKKVKGWKSLASLIDRRVVAQVVDWLRPPEDEDYPSGDGSMKRELLSAYMKGEIPPPKMLVPDVLYSGKLTWLQGEPGNGKTIYALWLAVQCINEGIRVMMIDEESGLEMTGERLAGLGADPSLTDDMFFYYPFSSINVMDPEHRQSFNGALDEAKPELVIFDSVADILAQSGLRENENDDINSFIKHFVDPLRKQEVASIFIDHMTKSSVDGGYARGAGSKKSKSDAVWTFTAPKAFDRHTLGRVSLKRAKDRLGTLPQNLLYIMGGDGKGNIVVKPTEVARQIVSPEDEHAARIIEFLKDKAPTEEEGLSSTAIVKGVKGDTNKLYKALNWLEENLVETPLEVVENGRSKLWFYAGDLEIDWAAVD